MIMMVDGSLLHYESVLKWCTTFAVHYIVINDIYDCDMIGYQPNPLVLDGDNNAELVDFLSIVCNPICIIASGTKSSPLINGLPGTALHLHEGIRHKGLFIRRSRAECLVMIRVIE